MVSQPDLQLSDERQVARPDEKKNKKWVTITPLIAETVWRRADTFSRGGRCYSPLMRISYEDSAEKQRWFQGAAVVLLFTVE